MFIRRVRQKKERSRSRHEMRQDSGNSSLREAKGILGRLRGESISRGIFRKFRSLNVT
jgi:hypothetical protein